MVKCRKLNTNISMISKGANMTTPANTPYRTGWCSLQALSLAISLLHMRRTLPGPPDLETPAAPLLATPFQPVSLGYTGSMTTPDDPLPVEPEPLSWVTGVDADDEPAEDADDG